MVHAPPIPAGEVLPEIAPDHARNLLLRILRFTALGISNLTDHSGIGRLSVVTLALTDLTVETFGSVNWGDGELRGYVPVFKDLLTSNGLGAQAESLRAPRWGAGVNLRVEL